MKGRRIAQEQWRSHYRAHDDATRRDCHTHGHDVASSQPAHTTAVEPPEVPATVKESIKALAVLPFVDLSQGHDQEYLADDMAEETLDLLTRIPQLPVIGRTSSFQFPACHRTTRSGGRTTKDHRLNADPTRLVLLIASGAEGIAFRRDRRFESDAERVTKETVTNGKAYMNQWSG
jgi:hypothetical protein